MVAMVLHSLNSLLSAYGAFSESRALLICSLVLRFCLKTTNLESVLKSKLFARFIVFWVTLAGVIVICLYGVEESKLLIKELDDVRPQQNVTFNFVRKNISCQVFRALIYRWDVDSRASRIVTQIQEYVGCCGAKKN